MQNQTYSTQALAAAIDRDPRLISLTINVPGNSADDGQRYPPLDHVVEVALDVPSLCAIDASSACCLLPEHAAVREMDAIRQERTLRALATRSRLATFDQSVWGKLRIEIGVTPELLVAPALQSEPRPAKTRNVVVFLNDQTPDIPPFGDVTAQIESLVEEANVIVKDNRRHGRLIGNEWLGPEIRDAICHVHLGMPSAGRACGRLIDSVACLLPVILLDDDSIAGDPSPDIPAPPCLLNEIHFMKVTSGAQFGASLAELMHDAALRAQLVANAAVLCRDYNAQVVSRALSFMLGEFTENPQ
ncbi:MAG: hypothetical protein HYX38_15095 [Rhodospirillales bacterium]|nr:hypothetical protein [Rhodospirillales bacterium]